MQITVVVVLVVVVLGTPSCADYGCIKSFIASSRSLNEVLRCCSTCAQDGYTALLKATETGNSELVKVLIDAGANLNIVKNVRFMSRKLLFSESPALIVFRS